MGSVSAFFRMVRPMLPHEGKIAPFVLSILGYGAVVAGIGYPEKSAG